MLVFILIFEALEEEEIDDTYTLETVHWKRNSGDDDEEYYPYAY